MYFYIQVISETTGLSLTGLLQQEQLMLQEVIKATFTLESRLNIFINFNTGMGKSGRASASIK